MVLFADPGGFFLARHPARIFEAILGLAQFTISESTNTLAPIKGLWGFLYKATLLVLSVVESSVIIFLNDVYEPFGYENLLYWYVALYDIHCDVILLWTVVVSSWMNAQRLMRLWKEMLDVDQRLRALHLPLQSFKKFALLWIVGKGCLSAVLHANSKELISHQQIKLYYVSNIIFLASNFYKICVEVNVISWIRVLNNRCLLLRDFLKNKSLPRVYVLRQVEEIHGHLAAVTKDVGMIYAAPILVTFTMDFFVNVFQAFDLATPYGGTQLSVMAVIDGLAWSCSFGSGSIVIIVLATSLSSHARSIKKELLKMMIGENDVAVLKEIKAFGLQILHEELKITAGGLLTINMTLMYQMITRGSTYMMILIQSDLTMFGNT